MRRRGAALLAVGAAAALLLSVVPARGPLPRPTVGPGTPASGTAPHPVWGGTGRDLETALQRLPARTPPDGEPMRLAAGLLPPTNRWFSGLVFGAEPQAVHPLPLAVVPTRRGVTASLPQVTATADTIFGIPTAGLGVDLGAEDFVVTHYDAVAVTLTYTRDGAPLADVVIARGWPYVAVTARRALDATLSVPVAPTVADSASAARLWRTTAGDVPYGLLAPPGAVDVAGLRLAAGERAVVLPLPATVDERAVVTGGRAVVTGGDASVTFEPDEVRTTLRYRTSGGATVLAALPQQRRAPADCSAGTVMSVHGPMALCSGTTVETTVPRLTPEAELFVPDLGPAERRAMRAQIRADASATPPPPLDTYAAGKWLYRLANLLQLARRFGTPADVADLRGRLGDALLEWTEPDGCLQRAERCFEYDRRLAGVVGRLPAFGSERFNDHHLHYGYFIHAAAVAVLDRPALASRLRPVIDLLVADIASPRTTERFPESRVFDAYAGHSWASGYAPFADGNNQESSSEAVTAWNAVALWAQATGDDAVRAHGVRLLSSEAHAARTTWLHPDLTPFPGFAHSFVSLNWGGKRDSATWFSADPAARLAIGLIPMSPVARYTRTTPERMRANLAEARASGSGLFADYLLMYEALIGDRTAAQLLERLTAIPDNGIDPANSRSYVMAWIAATAG